MRRFWKNQKGLTMMEVLVTVALLAIVIVPCLSSFVMAQRGNVLADEVYDEYTTAANIMEELKSIPEGASWSDSVEQFVENFNEDDERTVSVFCIYSNAPQYFEIRIYQGQHSTEPTGDDAEALILKGVIAP